VYDAFCRAAGADDVFVAEGKVIDVGCDISLNAAVSIGDGCWTAEIALPFAELEITREAEGAWGINIARNRLVDGQSEMSSYVPLQETFHQPERFMSAVLEGLDVSPYLWFISAPRDGLVYRRDGKLFYRCSLYVRNMTGRFQIMRLAGELSGGSGLKSETAMDIAANDDKEQKIELSFPLMEEGVNTLTAAIARRVSPDVVLKTGRFRLNLGFNPVALRFVSPSYRDNIYATQKIREIEVETRLELPADEMRAGELLLELRGSGGGTSYSSAQLKGPSAASLSKLDVSGLPEGAYEVTAVFRDKSGTGIYRSARQLNKLPYRQGEVWLDGSGVTHVDGKPFFPFGWFSAPHLGKGTENYNTVQRYTPFLSEQDMEKWLDTAHSNGLKALIYPYQEFRSDWNLILFARYGPRQQELTPEQAARIKYVVNRFKNHPAILGWYMSDEPESMDESVAWHKSVYQLVRETDPYHPCILLNFSIRGMEMYHEACDILMPDCYPDYQADGSLKQPMDEIGRYVDAGKKLRPMWIVPQAFDWSWWKGDRYKNSRGPTFRELRNQVYQAINHGANGVLLYDWSFNYPEQRTSGSFLYAEIQSLKQALLAPASENGIKAAVPDGIPFSCSLRKAGGHLYLFAVNSSNEEMEAAFDIEGLGKENLFVVSEGRNIVPAGGKFRDRFGKYETHIYTNNPMLKSKSLISKLEYETSEESRRKPGNLLFMNRETVLTASSAPVPGYHEVAHKLSFLVDGVTEDVGNLFWGFKGAATKDTPAWIEVTLSHPEKISRIVLYSPNLEDFSLQADTGAGWNTVKEVNGNASETIEAAFPAVEAKRIRLLITKARQVPRHSIIPVLYEIEAYGD